MRDRPGTESAERLMVVLGDSLAEGRDDPDPGGGWIGWARRLADHLELPREGIANPASPGATAQVVAGEQLPGIRHLHPRLVMLNCGMNDVLNPYERSAVVARLGEVFGWARATGAAMIAAPVPHPPLLERSPLSEFRRKRTRQRIHDYNEDLGRLAEEFGHTFLPPDAVPLVDDPAYWSADGIHLNSAGHAYVAEVIVHVARGLLFGHRVV